MEVLGDWLSKKPLADCQCRVRSVIITGIRACDDDWGIFMDGGEARIAKVR